jgi:hypothetical protein
VGIDTAWYNLGMSAVFKKWDHTLHLPEYHSMPSDTTEEINALGKYVAREIKAHPVYKEHSELEEIAEAFEDADSIKSFDYAMERLYDFADYNKFMWVDTGLWS